MVAAESGTLFTEPSWSKLTKLARSLEKRKGWRAIFHHQLIYNRKIGRAFRRHPGMTVDVTIRHSLFVDDPFQKLDLLGQSLVALNQPFDFPDRVEDGRVIATAETPTNFR